MERIGDHAADISEITICMVEEKKSYLNNLEHVQEMAKETSIMLVGSVDAFVKKNQEQARQVIQQDDIVDELFTAVRREVIELVHQKAEHGEQMTDLLMVAKYFERIGDHATNIAEWVIFSITGSHEAIYQN